MGVIYTTEQLMKGQFPSDGDHIAAAEKVISEVPDLDCVCGTLVHGSVPEGRHNRRSDLDVLVYYDVESVSVEPIAIRGIKGVLDVIGEEHGVNIEHNIWPAKESDRSRGERLYDMLFSMHLAQSMQNRQWFTGIVDRSIERIATDVRSTSQLDQIIVNYLVYKNTGFAKAPLVMQEGPKELAALQRAFELPKSIYRKIKQYADFTGIDMSEWGELDALLYLRDTDTDYTELLESICGTLTPAELEDHRAWLADRYPRSIDLGIIATRTIAEAVAAHSEDRLLI